MKKLLISLMLMLFGIVSYSQETIIIGNQIWMKDNLNVGIMIPATQPQTNNVTIEKYCYQNLSSNCDKFGGYYSWDEAMKYVTTPGTQGICPNGFHIPTYDEWMELLNYCGGTSQAGTMLNDPSTLYWKYYYKQAWTPTNSTGFSAKGNGYISNNRFGLMQYASYFWTSSVKSFAELAEFYPGYATNTTTHQVVISGNNYGPKMEPFLRYPHDAVAIRCIKD